MLTEGRPCNNKETFLPDAIDCEVAFDAAALVQALSVDHRPHRLVDVVGADPVEEGKGTGSAHFDLVERGLVEQTRDRPRLQVFMSDGARPVVVRPAERFVSMRRFLFVGLEPVRSFPAELFAERTAQVAQTDRKSTRLNSSHGY